MTLTDEQVNQLADEIIDGNRNVYREAERLFGVEVSDEVFDQLEKIAGIFKCDDCNQWLAKAYKDMGLESTCTVCSGEEPE